jgi:hypothetical protein
MLDADAYLGRRAWLPCPRCYEDGCMNCAVNHTCDQHWRYLLANEGLLVFLQCPTCMHRWWHDTGTSGGNNPPAPFFTPRREAA